LLPPDDTIGGGLELTGGTSRGTMLMAAMGLGESGFQSAMRLLGCD